MKIHNKIFLATLGIMIIITYCIYSFFINFLDVGTHGSIKHYQYCVPKNILEIAIKKVITNAKNIQQDSIKDYYNNDTTYVTIKVFDKEDTNQYIFRYEGDTSFWRTASVSSFFIAYAHNRQGKGGNIARGDFKWYDFKLKEKLLSTFERNFVEKINKELKKSHAKCK